MTATELEAIVRPLLDDAGFELVECNVSRLQRSQIFRVYIDHEGGVAVEACAKMSRLISSELDTNPLLRGAYRIEVSSPGMNRSIRTPEHFQRFRGERVQIELAERDASGARHLTGVIGDIESGAVWIEPDQGDAVAVAFDRIESARLRLDPWKGKRGGGSERATTHDMRTRDAGTQGAGARSSRTQNAKPPRKRQQQSQGGKRAGGPRG